MSDEILDKLNLLGEKILTASKNELYLSMEFLDVALEALEYKMDIGSENIGTDGSFIIFNPKYIAESYEKDRVFINRAYMHILMHCLFRHIYNGKRKNVKYWDLSCDIAAEYVLDTMNCSAISKNISCDREFTYKKLKDNMKELTAERIYDYLSELGVSGKEYERLAKEFKVDSHKMWAGSAKSEKSDDARESGNAPEKPDENSAGSSGKPDKREESKDQNADSGGKSSENGEKEKDWEKIGEETVKNLQKGLESGSETGAFSKMLKARQKNKYDYKKFLSKFAVYDEVMKIDEDSFDYGFYNYGFSLYKNMPLIEPLEYKEIKAISDFVIALDTSASCDESKIKLFLSQTYEILKSRETFFEKSNIYIMQCDNQVKKCTKIADINKFDPIINAFEIKGGGGTDFRPVFNYTGELIKKGDLKNLKGLIYFTDGKGKYPEKKPPYETAFVFLDDDCEGVPPWAYKITVKTAELEENAK